MFRASKAVRWLGLMFLVLAGAIQSAGAQGAFPSRPIRVINPLATGGALDVMLRQIGQAYTERTGQGFVVDSRPGANTIIAAETCANAPPDGYTICLLSNSTISINPTLYKKLPYTVRSFEPVTQVVFGTQVMVVNPAIPANDIKEFVAYSKANPQKINFASLGAGGDSHLMMEWLRKQTGADWTHVPYKGYPPALQAFTAGEVQIMFVLVGNPNLVNEINAGHIKALMTASNARSPLLPNVPTFSESGYPLESKTWFGLFAPAGTPKDIVAKLNADIAAIIRSDSFKSRYLVPAGFEPVGSAPEAFAQFIAADVQNGKKLVEISGITLDQ